LSPSSSQFVIAYHRCNMNIDPAAMNAIIVAEEVGLLGDQAAAVDGITGIADAAEDADISSAGASTDVGIPNIPPINAGSLPAVAANETVAMLGYTIEGIDEAEPHIRRHAIAFYNKLIPMFEEASAQFFLMSHEKYNMIVGSLQRIQDGEPLAALRRLYPNIHYWNKKYSIIEDGVGGHMLVMRPKINGDDDTVDMAELKRVTYLERVFKDILTAHGDDHRKGRTLYSSLGDVVHNVPRDVCKIFTDLCAHCIQRHH
jgi:hypothetical protein